MFQENAMFAWIYMGVYWFSSAALNREYFARLVRFKEATFLHLIALGITIACQNRFNQRFSRYGRPRNVLVSAVYAVSNGILETFCFLGVYDFGRHRLREFFLLSKPSAILIGWSLYYMYSALIHALFWLPLVFPRHTKSTAPPFHKHGLKLLTVVSIAWFTIYEVYDDVAFVCFLHMIIDGWAAWSIGLQAPCQATVKRKT